MDEELDDLAQRYGHRRNITLHERLGFGVHGTVLAAEDKAEDFGEKWPEVMRVLSELQKLDIYLLDINPRNISFL